jgi:Ser/Thr protein kinase RdoA (MazF antagonist)
MFAGALILEQPLALALKAITHWDCIVGVPAFVMHRENAVFKIETNVGFAALRIHRPGYHTRIEIESELQWMAHLAQSGLEVPTPFFTRQGSFVAEVQDSENQTYLIDLLSWLDGEPLGKSRVPLAFADEQLNAIFYGVGRTLAYLHQASDTWTPPGNFYRHALDCEGLLGETAAWGRFWEATCLSPDEQKLMTNVRELAICKVDALAAAGADYGLIHADLVRENILIANGQTRFIDFDDAGFGFRMFDIAVALVKNRDEPQYENMKNRLFAGYKAVRQLSAVDENSVELFLALRDFAYLGWADARRHEPEIAPRLSMIKKDTLEAAKTFLAPA